MTAPARPLSAGLARLVAEMELRQPTTLVTMAEIAELAQQAGLATPAAVLAARLRAAGWLLRTAQRVVYEFAPGAHAGPYGHGDPFVDLRAALMTAPLPVVLALQSALWLHGWAERAPDRHEVAVPVKTTVPESIRRQMRVTFFTGRLDPVEVEQLPVQQAATLLVHLATKPGDVRGWAGFAEALPDLVAGSTFDQLHTELGQRPSTVRPRLAYLLSGVAPQLAEQLQPTRPPTVTWFGRGRTSLRFDKRFNIADALLPFDPRTLAGTVPA